MYFSEGGDIDVTENYPPRLDIGLNIGMNYKIISDLDIEASTIMDLGLYIVLMLPEIAIVIVKDLTVFFK